VRRLIALACLLSTLPLSTISALQAQDLMNAQRLSVLPPDPFEPAGTQDLGITPLPDLTETELFTRLAKIYAYQADMLSARARGAAADASDILEYATIDLVRLARHENVRSDARFQDLYRIIVAENERINGSSDQLWTPFGDVFQIRDEMFSLLEDIRDPLLEDVLQSDLQPMTTTVPMTRNRLVESSIAYLLKNPDKHLNHWLSRAETYLPMIEKIFAEEGVPDELKYLSMVESGLNPRARSWARAVGMWQFIAATGKAYGLDVNSWVDERMDPEKSTRAAARHLKSLFQRYGDWQIALAGYNCSPRCISRAIRRSRSTGVEKPSYWDIYRYLPRETRNYVPMFIAASLVASNPSAFDLPPVKAGPIYEYQVVPVQGMHSLADLAPMAGTDKSILQALNPNLRRYTLPPSTGPFYLRIPAGSRESFLAAYEALPAAAKRPSGEYIVRSGDTLGRIGQVYGVSVSRLMQKNGLRNTRIRIGQRLVVPLSEYSAVEIEDLLADGSDAIIQYGRRASRPIRSIAAREAVTGPRVVKVSTTSERPARANPQTSSGTRVTYTIRRGDSLGKIAARYGVSIARLKAWNSLTGNRIRTGDRLILFPETTETSETSPPLVRTYRVKAGDTLSEIAISQGVSLSELRKWNSISGSRIRVGQRLTIRPSGSRQTVTHTVRRGDTLIEIAARYAVSVGNVKAWNGLRSNTIRIGQRLQIQQ